MVRQAVRQAHGPEQSRRTHHPEPSRRVNPNDQNRKFKTGTGMTKHLLSDGMFRLLEFRIWGLRFGILVPYPGR